MLLLGVLSVAAVLLVELPPGAQESASFPPSRGFFGLFAEFEAGTFDRKSWLCRLPLRRTSAAPRTPRGLLIRATLRCHLGRPRPKPPSFQVHGSSRNLLEPRSLQSIF